MTPEASRMTPFEFRPIPHTGTVEVLAGNGRVATLRQDAARGAWFVEAGGRSGRCPSFGAALNYIDKLIDQESN
jgi:hypothetical protein